MGELITVALINGSHPVRGAWIEMILSAWIIDEKRWKSYKKHRKILYERGKT